MYLKNHKIIIKAMLSMQNSCVHDHCVYLIIKITKKEKKYK